MSVSKERTVSLWMETEVAPEAPPLRADDRADVVVVGSGIAGLSTAYELASARPGRGGSGPRPHRQGDDVAHDRAPDVNLRRSASIPYIELARPGSRQALLSKPVRGRESDRGGAARGEHPVQFPAGWTGFCSRRSAAILPFSTKELEAVRRIGVAVEGARGVPFKGQDKTRCLRYPDQATFHPLRYLRGLTRALLDAATARLYADTVVESVEEDEGGVTVLTEGRQRGASAGGRHRHQLTHQRPCRHPHQAGALPYLRDGLHHSARRNARWSLLGYARRLSLRPPPARPRHDRLPDRGRRRPQDRRGR